MPCSSVSLLQNFNKGTRTSLRPEGDGSLEREELGNRLADAVCLLVQAQHEVGGYFSIENPRFFHFLEYASIRELFKFCCPVYFDQCMYGLAPPNSNNQPKSKSIGNPTPPGDPGICPVRPKQVNQLPFVMCVHALRSPLVS